MDQVKSVVVLMLENRSFDLVLGNCYSAEDLQSVKFNFPGITTPDEKNKFKGRFHFENEIKTNGISLEKLNIPEKQFELHQFNFPEIGPGEDLDHVGKQLYNPEDDVLNWGEEVDLKTRIQGTINDYNSRINDLNNRNNNNNNNNDKNTTFKGEDIIAMFSAEALPVINTFAKEFAVCDEWFCSVPSQTWPNRLFLHNGTSGGVIKNEGIKESIESFIKIVRKWDKSVFKAMKMESQILCPSKISLTQVLHPTTLVSKINMEEFENQCNSNSLKNYTFIEPQFWTSKNSHQNDQHPIDQYKIFRYQNSIESESYSISYAEDLILKIYKAMFIDNNYGMDRLFIILYDEHGGCFDHISPPSCSNPDNDSREAYFERLGVRVPAVFISPLIAPNTILRSRENHFDHTSLIKSLKDKWTNFKYPTTERIKDAESFWHVFQNNNGLNVGRMKEIYESAKLKHDQNLQDQNISIGCPKSSTCGDELVLSETNRMVVILGAVISNMGIDWIKNNESILGEVLNQINSQIKCFVEREQNNSSFEYINSLGEISKIDWESLKKLIKDFKSNQRKNELSISTSQQNKLSISTSQQNKLSISTSQQNSKPNFWQKFFSGKEKQSEEKDTKKKHQQLALTTLP